MYSPDGFASLACSLHGQCHFLGWQQPFIELMHVFNTPALFFLLQALVWFALIGVIYFLAKELKVKHLFITPAIMLFGTIFFTDLFVGSFENDCFGIILILIGFIFYYKSKHTAQIKYLFLSGTSFLFSLTYWLWVGYLIKMPVLIHQIAEQMVWIHWVSWLFVLPFIILCIISGIKYKDNVKISTMLFILFFPKLFIFGVPILLKFIDEIMHKALQDKNKRFLIHIIIFSLIIGQCLRVGIYEYNSATRIIEDENCVTVNDEYFLRVTKGLNYTYNQLSIGAVEKCKQNKSVKYNKGTSI